MDGLADGQVRRLDRFELDIANGGLFRLTKAGPREKVALGSRALIILAALVARAGELVSKQDLLDEVWPGVMVEEKNLTVQISALRRVLDEGRVGESCIQTVPGRGYRFLAPPVPAEIGQAADLEAAARPGRRRPFLLVLGSVAALLLIGLVGARSLVRTNGATLSQRESLPVAYSPQDRRQSLIVMPFENSSADPAQDSVADGLSRDIADQIAEDPTSPLVPAMTAAAYRGTRSDLHDIGKAHDVHFALTGNARLVDGHLIVSVTLFETANVRQVWSRQFDTDNTSDAKRLIVRATVTNIDQATTDSEAARALREHPERLDKRDLMFIATSSSFMEETEARNAKQIELIDRALALDPDYPWALRESARKHADRVINGFSTDEAGDLAIAIKNVDRALVLKPDDFYNLREKAVVLRAQGNWTEAVALNQRLIERKPLQGFRHFQLGASLMALGRHAEALESLQTARKLAFGTDSVNVTDSRIAMALLALGRFAEAAEQARFAAQEFSAESGWTSEVPWLTLIAAEWQGGQAEQARKDLARFLGQRRSFANLKLVRRFASFAANPNLLAGLAGAGMPEG